MRLEKLLFFIPPPHGTWWRTLQTPSLSIQICPFSDDQSIGPVLENLWIQWLYISTILSGHFSIDSSWHPYLRAYLMTHLPLASFHCTTLFPFHADCRTVSLFLLLSAITALKSILGLLSSVYHLCWWFCEPFSSFSQPQLFCWIFKTILDFFHLNFWAAHQSPRIKVSILSPQLESFPTRSVWDLGGPKVIQFKECQLRKGMPNVK